MHRSPRHGFSVEFAQHRDYVLGDDIRHVDWKVYGRTERFFLKQYELETNLVLWLLVDGSDSMRYASGSVMKYDYAATAAASLAYLAHRQSDSFGLATFDAKIQAQLRPSSQSSHLNDMLRILSNGPSSEKSRIGGVLHEAADRFVRRGIVVVFSDLFDEPAEILSGMRHLRHCRHEVVVFHVLDPAEIEFPFREATLFRGLEQLPDLLTDPLGVRESYLSEFGKYLEEIEQGCRTQNIEYVRMNTERDLGEALAEYLGRRAGS
ncbi:MAG: DUF58 domain-containing protein [Planctomycetes bacterium]|nr:DUF58 domain-containing protein [Planctomycetota bacterium]